MKKKIYEELENLVNANEEKTMEKVKKEPIKTHIIFNYILPLIEYIIKKIGKKRG